MEFIATCAAGFENLLAQELKSLGVAEVRPLKGQVAFFGELEGAYRALMYSRIASRILLVLGRIEAANSDALYEGVMSFAWEDHLAAGRSFSVSAHGTNSELKHSGFVALRTKDAISDRMLERAGVKPQTNPDRPDMVFDLRLHGERATVSIDLAGMPLFARAWERPLKAGQKLGGLRPDYAAALLAHAGWYRNLRHENPQLVDVFCGSGTVLVEAATQALGIAPGLTRTRWTHTAWLGADAACWQAIQEEARSTQADLAQRELMLVGLDTRSGFASAARDALHAAGITLKPKLFSAAGGLSPEATSLLHELGPDALVTLNADALSHLGIPGEAKLFNVSRQVSAALPDELGFATISAHSLMAQALGREELELVPTYLGQKRAHMALLGPAQAEPCTITVSKLTSAQDLPSSNRSSDRGSVQVATQPQTRTVSCFVSNSEQFAARLAKRYKHLRKWAKREGIDAWRVYDQDLPDYNVSIDLLDLSHQLPGGRMSEAQRWAYIAEYAPPKEVDTDLARQRLLDIMNITSAVLDIDPAHIVVRVRERSRGGEQYGRQTESNSRSYRPPVVQEGGLYFELNMHDYLDYGLFLDHRETRALVRELAKHVPANGRFLNLFAYTGSATCYAADGGVSRSVTVDLSNTYLAWAQRNLELNGFVEAEAKQTNHKEHPHQKELGSRQDHNAEAHQFVRADVLRWIENTRHSPERFDLIFCDPPTFSNSSKMRGRGFDVQRDHVELVIGLSRLLTPGGTCIFSCNLRNFEPDLDALARAGVKMVDITPQTIPLDFERNHKIHHCYEVTRLPRPKGLSANHPTSNPARRPRGREEHGVRTGGRSSNQSRASRDTQRSFEHKGPRNSSDQRGPRPFRGRGDFPKPRSSRP